MDSQKDIIYLRLFLMMVNRHYMQACKYANKKVPQRTVKYNTVLSAHHYANSLKQQAEWLEGKIKSLTENNS